MDTSTAASHPLAGTQVLAVDIFGTVVDWHGSIAREMAERHPAVDGNAFALAWRAGYKPAMARVMRGELGWTVVESLPVHEGIKTRGADWDRLIAHYCQSLRNLAAIGYTGTFASLIAYLLWNHGIAVLGVAKASLTNYLMP
eukprot:gene12953-15830_t